MSKRIIAEVTTYAEFIEAVRTRVAEIGVPMEAIDEHAGLAARHTSKLLAPSHIRRFGAISFDAMLPALGLRLAVVADPDTPALIRKRFGGYTNEGTSLRAIRRRKANEGRE